MNLGQTALQVLQTVAPKLGLALGGPLGGMAGGMLSVGIGKLLGKQDAAGATVPATQKEIETALTGGDPQTLLAVKNIEADLTKHLEDLGIQDEQLRFADTASARNREIQLRDKLPAILAITVTIGFFGVLVFMCWHGTPTTGGEPFLVMLGSLATAWTGIVGYYFGSSAGSADKTDTINKIAAAKP
jgi:hypothetical protein